MYRYFVWLLLLSLPCWLTAQAYKVEGKIQDAHTGESLPGVNILLSSGGGTASDINGNFSLQLGEGKHLLTFRYIGYQQQSLALELNANRRLIISMIPQITELEQVVVSAGRFEQKLSDIPLSMELLKANMVVNQGTTSMETVLSKVPGLNILDGQANIRSGSGWSYGAGSRVLLLLDGMPLLSPDAGDVKWNYLPIEILEQVEVLKGASSVLYGSSALNGIIHFRTREAGVKPATQLVWQSGMYMKPKRQELVWWDNINPLLSSLSLSHSRKIGRHDLVAGVYGFSDAGYRTDNNQKRARVNLKYRCRHKSIEGLVVGINANGMHIENNDFFLWMNADSGAWRQNPATVSMNKGIRANIDPYLNYYTPGGSRHSLSGRIFKTSNVFPADAAKDNNAMLYFSEYQFYRKIGWLNISSGASGYYSESVSSMFGNHNSTNAAVYTQLDMEAGLWLFSAGMRYENFRLDTIKAESRPVFRAGVSLKMTPSTIFRSSFGMGYRFPSIAEKYTYTKVGGVTVYPSPQLSSESGWNAEAGIKQGLKIAQWTGYLDMVAFYTEYHNMMEFVFGFYDTLTFHPTTQYFTLNNMGFQSQNIGAARITGWEISLAGHGNIGSVSLSVLAGYTYSLPVDMNRDSTYRAGKSDDNNYLKYRNIHSFKADLHAEFREWQIGFTAVYTSKILNVDAVFVDPFLGEIILPGYADYRNRQGKGHWVQDVRISYDLRASSRISLIARNVFNVEYIGRPGDIRPPRTLMLQYMLRL